MKNYRDMSKGLTPEQIANFAVNRHPDSINTQGRRDALRETLIEMITKCDLSNVNVSLPSVEEAGITAVKISESVKPELKAQEQAFFIAGFQECIKWLGSNDS